MTLYKWSQTAANNATADASVNWQEGQAPSSVNDSARAMMASVAKYRDDVSGAIITSGTSTAYAVSSYETFDTLAHLNGQVIAFTPHATNGATVTLNVDSLGAKPLRSSVGVDLLAGVLIQGTPYVAVYSNLDGVFYLQGFFGNPYNVPLGAGMDYWGTTAPNTSFAIPTGQAISRTTYATLFALIGTQYGSGNGSTTFNLPDKTGRVSAMYEPGGSMRLTSTYFGGNSTALGAAGGTESQTLTASQIPSITSVNPSQAINVTSNSAIYPSGQVISSMPATGGAQIVPVGGLASQSIASSGNNSISVTSNNTSGQAHPNVQPTIICNYILRII
jgi:microcystin-dependent protein